ncbi:hypothetical protein Taro_048580 [Colocasia esculenta]|uniref:Retrotransposon gag domain-containing protein n=1 Tax=Colocasia esculenta TaxID=4460 RepID=A0A843X8H4_COLES|nr:hypothetical protein [Colocasia esculenta]
MKAPTGEIRRVVVFVTAYPIRGRCCRDWLRRVREALSGQIRSRAYPGQDGAGFLTLTQGSMTILEYEARFAELSKYAPHIVTDERKKAKKFVMGLKPSLRTRLVAFDHRTLDEALNATCRKEGEMEQ